MYRRAPPAASVPRPASRMRADSDQVSTWLPLSRRRSLTLLRGTRHSVDRDPFRLAGPSIVSTFATTTARTWRKGLRLPPRQVPTTGSGSSSGPMARPRSTLLDCREPFPSPVPHTVRERRDLAAEPLPVRRDRDHRRSLD